MMPIDVAHATPQSAVTPPNAMAPASAASEDAGISEIVVTAQKRNQSVQDVGITMSVVSSEALANSGATSVTDLTGLVPNMQANYGAGQVAFNVRGIGTNEFSANLDSPVAVNLDEVYLAKTFMTGLLLFDVDRVEVLKGPQGTLFGRNATGGAVNFFTRKPTEQFSIGGTVSYDNYQTVRTEGYISGPLGGGFSARISGMLVDQGKGYYRNLTLGNREGAEKRWALRGQLAWDDADTRVNLTVNAGRQTGTLQPYESVGVYTPESFATSSLVRCAAYQAGTVRGNDPNCVRGTDGLNPGDNDPYTTTGNRPHTVSNKGAGAILRIEHDFDNATLTSLSSYQFFRRRQHEDSDESPGDFVDVDSNNVQKQFTQELRLNSTGSGRWNYVLGAYYEHDQYTNGDYFEVGYGAGVGLWSPFTQKVDALAVFFHNNVELTNTLSLTAGVRYSRETINFDGGTYAGSGVGGVPPRPTTIVGPTAVTTASRTDDAATFKLGVEWKPQLSSTWIDKLMFYGNVSTGFRSGSFNSEFVGSIDALTSLSPEKITAYEAGFKSVTMNRKLLFNASVFHYNFSDGFINVDNPSSPIPLTVNAASIKSYGVEFDAEWRPIRQFTLSMGGSWLRSRIASDISVGGQSLRGNRTVQSPKWTYTVQGTFDQPIANGLDFFASSDANYRSSQYFETTNSVNSLEPGYWIVNARLGLKSSDDRWSIGVFARNATKAVYRTYVNDLPDLGFLLNIYGNPRTYGLSASFKL